MRAAHQSASCLHCTFTARAARYGRTVRGHVTQEWSNGSRLLMASRQAFPRYQITSQELPDRSSLAYNLAASSGENSRGVELNQRRLVWPRTTSATSTSRIP